MSDNVVTLPVVRIERLDGIMSEDFITRSALNPEWEKVTKVHDWRNHVPENIQVAWDSFTLEQKTMLVEWAESLASCEEWD